MYPINPKTKANKGEKREYNAGEPDRKQIVQW